MAKNENTNVSTSSGAKAVASYNQTPDSVTVQSIEQEAWVADSVLPRTLLKGTKGMKAASTEFLPAHPLESAIAYDSRLRRSTLLNAYRKTVSFLSGQVFQSDITFSDEVPETFETLAESIDIKKNALDVFAKRAFSNGLGKGVSIIMVDAPKAKEGEDVIRTVADEKAAGFRAYFKEIDPEMILGGLVGDEGRLIQIRIQESVQERVGRFGSKTIQRVRVLEPGTWETHTVDDKGSVSQVESGTTIPGVIPIAIFIPGDETTILTGETPLMDLAELNSKHWRSSSDQDNILHVARVPIMFTKMVDLAAVPIGTANAINSNDADASMEYVEHSGAAIAAGRVDLEDTQAQMALYGLQQLIPRTGTQTATEKALTSSESSSSLATWTIEFESVVQEAFEYMGMFLGEAFPANGVTLNKEFGLGTADPEELAKILESYDKGLLSAQAAFSEFKRRGVFEEHLSFEDMEADKEEEKRANIEMAQLAGAAFGDDTNTGDDENGTGKDNDSSTGDDKQ